LPAERFEFVRDHLIRHGRVVAAELAAALGISEDTIRRDLRDLASQGVCKRVYGGAILTSPASGSARQRTEQSPDRKRRLGDALAGLVKADQLVFIDAGSTNLAAARAMPTGLGVTVATHDPAVAAALIGRDGVELLLVGGRIDPHTGAAMGGATLRAVTSMRPDIVLLGACSLDAQIGIGAFNAEDADLKRALLENAGSVAIAVLNEKLSAAARYEVASASVIADLVVEADAPVASVKAFCQLGIRIHHAQRTDGN
jgi:DeoR/GlpR family transcriptional regulator of sugar metabolism